MPEEAVLHIIEGFSAFHALASLGRPTVKMLASGVVSCAVAGPGAVCA